MCCCRATLEPFYQGNWLRLKIIGTGLLLFIPLEIAGLWLAIKHRLQKPSWGLYLIWVLARSLVALLLLLAVIALPGIQLFYLITGVIGLWSLMGQSGVRHEWAPVFRLSDQLEQQPRSHFKGLMIYFCLTFFLLPIFFMAKAWACDCSKLSSVKANMHTLQNMVETYAVQNKGRYPKDVLELRRAATLTGHEYWKEFTNPFTGRSGFDKTYKPLPKVESHSEFWGKPENGAPWMPYRDVLGVRVYHQIFGFYPDYGGVVIYAPSSSTQYHIYGMAGNSNFLTDKGLPLTLSND